MKTNLLVMGVTLMSTASFGQYTLPILGIGPSAPAVTPVVGIAPVRPHEISFQLTCGGAPRYYPQLVSNQTYRRSFAKGFGKILSFENAANAGTRYAALDVSAEKAEFDFAPFNVAINRNNVLKALLNFHLKGSTNSDGVASVFSGGEFNNNWSVGANLSFVGGFDRFKADDAAGAATATNACVFRAMQNGLYNAILQKYTDLYNDITAAVPTPTSATNYINNYKTFRSNAALSTQMTNEYMDMEELNAKPFWNTLFRSWLTVSPSIGRISTAVLNSSTGKIEDVVMWTPIIRAALNTYIATHNQRQILYGTIAGSFSKKNSFTGQDAVTWNMIEPLTATSFLVTDKKDVYMYSQSNYKEEMKFKGTSQIIFMNMTERMPIGLDLAFTADQLIKLSTQSGESWKTTASYGLIFPFNDKDGDRTINVEVFYARTNTSNSPAPDKNYVGIKFAVPFKSW